MIPRIKPLPHWVLTDLQPAFYDTESVTVLEAVSKLYAKVNEVIGTVDIQDKNIEEAVKYLQDNLVATVTALYEKGFEEGAYTSHVSVTYNAEDESLDISDTLTESEES